MRHIKIFAILALALSLGLISCKKGTFGSEKDLSGTVWDSAMHKISDSASETTWFYLEFFEGKKCTLQVDREVRTKMSDPDEESIYVLAGTFSLNGDKLTVNLKRVEEDEEGVFSGKLPMTLKGDWSDTELIHLVIDGVNFEFHKRPPLPL